MRIENMITQVLSFTSVRNVWKYKRRICNLILGLKGLSDHIMTDWHSEEFETGGWCYFEGFIIRQSMVCPAVTFYWLAVAVEVMQFLFILSHQWRRARSFRLSQSNIFYRDLGNFSTAAVHETKIRRKNIFSGAYF